MTVDRDAPLADEMPLRQAIAAAIAALSPAQRRRLIAHLTPTRAPERIAKMNHALAHRTRYLTIVLEDIFQPHNAAAVLRSCDGFGVQDIHVIEKRNTFAPENDVAMGTEKWLTLRRYTQTAECLERLKERGYALAAATVRPGARPLHELPLERPLAILIGHERNGLSAVAHDAADHWYHLPMRGFADSFNLSVFCALTLYDLTTRLHQTARSPTDSRPGATLSEDERTDLKLAWLLADTRAALVQAHDFAMANGWPWPQQLAATAETAP